MAFPKFEILLLLFVVFSLGQSVSLFEKISKYFPEYRKFETVLWRNVTSNLGGFNSKEFVLQQVMDYHKTYLSRHPLVNLPRLSNKFSRNAAWEPFKMNMQWIRNHFKDFRNYLNLKENSDFTNELLRELSSTMLETSDAVLDSTENAIALLAKFKGEKIRRKCSLTSEYMQWESLLSNVYAHLLRTYILTEYAWMYQAIRQNVIGIHYLKDKQLRDKFRKVENAFLNNFRNGLQNITNHAINRCPPPLKFYHNVTLPAKFSLKEVTSDIKRNMVIVGFRFHKPENETFYHLQIREGRLGPDGRVVNATTTWKPIVDSPVHKLKKDIDYFELTEHVTFESEIRREQPFVVTGLKLSNNANPEHKSGFLSLMVRFNEIDIEKGVLNNETDNWGQGVADKPKYIQLENNFYLDKRSIKLNLLTPLSGAGISCNQKPNNSKDVLCYPKIFAFMP